MVLLHVSVVNSYAPTSDVVWVTLESSVDLPTLGKPTIATRASPERTTSNPAPAFDFAVGSSSIVL